MIRSLSKLSITLLVLVVSFLFLSSPVFAQAPIAEEPFLDFVGSFSYSECKRKSGCELSFSSWNISGGNYIDGSYFGEGDDSITNAVFSISGLFNDDGNPGDNLEFGATRGTNDPVTFEIVDGGTTYFSAQLNNFVIEDGLFGTRLLLNTFTDGMLTNPTFNANGSQYIEELESRYNATWELSLGMDFAFNSGSSGSGTAFTDNASGSISGKIGVVPEPISSILFLSGAATLGARRFWKKKKTATS